MKQILIGVVIGIIAISIIIGIGISLGQNKSTEVQVPNLIGLTVNDAKEKVKKLGLEIRIDEDTEGVVIYQEPPYIEGYLIKNNTVIYIETNKR